MAERRRTWLDVVVVAGVAVGALLACQMNAGGGDEKANIDCEGQADGVACTVKHTAGTARVNACWDVVFQCNNGTTSQASACQKVGPGETAQRMIPKAQVSNWDKCDKAVSASVTNMKLTRE